MGSHYSTGNTRSFVFKPEEKLENEWYMKRHWASQVVLVVKNVPDNAEDIRDAGSIPGWGRSPGGGHGNTL